MTPDELEQRMRDARTWAAEQAKVSMERAKQAENAAQSAGWMSLVGGFTAVEKTLGQILDPIDGQ